MSTPHDDDAPPDPIDTVTPADLDLVERLDREATPGPWEVRYEREGRGVSQPDHKGSDRFILEEGANGVRADAELAAAARTLLPRLARAYRRVCEERDSGLLTDDLVAPAVAKAEADAYARGRREAIEEAARRLEEIASQKEDSVIEAAASWVREIGASK